MTRQQWKLTSYSREYTKYHRGGFHFPCTAWAFRLFATSFLAVVRIAKTDKKRKQQYWFFTKTVYYKVSCGVVVGWVLKATWTGVRILQARCVSCRVSLALAATHTGIPHLFLPRR